MTVGLADEQGHQQVRRAMGGCPEEDSDPGTASSLTASLLKAAVESTLAMLEALYDPVRPQPGTPEVRSWGAA